VSIAVANDDRWVLISTNTKSLYKLILPEVSSKAIVLESDFFEISKLAVKYPKSTIHYNQTVATVLIGQDLMHIFSGDETGSISVWVNKEILDTNCGIILKGHTSPIADLKITQNQDLLFSLGLEDQCLLEWKSKPGLT
jgi:hypothetical protein